MDWDHTDTAPGPQPATLTVLGADLGEVFFEDTKHRRSDVAPARPSALAAALGASRDLFVARSALAEPAPAGVDWQADGDDRVPAQLVRLLHGACRRVLAGTASAGVELLVAAGERVARMIPGTTRLDPALPLTSGRREAFRRALANDGNDQGERGDVSTEREERCAIAIIAYPMRLVLAAQEAGASCPLSRAYRRTLVEAGALLEAISNGLTGAGLEVEPRLHFFDDELDGALALEGVVEVVVAVLLVDLGGDGSR